jgi:hypothetical protein
VGSSIDYLEGLDTSYWHSGFRLHTHSTTIDCVPGAPGQRRSALHTLSSVISTLFFLPSPVARLVSVTVSGSIASVSNPGYIVHIIYGSSGFRYSGLCSYHCQPIQWSTSTHIIHGESNVATLAVGPGLKCHSVVSDLAGNVHSQFLGIGRVIAEIQNTVPPPTPRQA